MNQTTYLQASSRRQGSREGVSTANFDGLGGGNCLRLPIRRQRSDAATGCQWQRGRFKTNLKKHS